MYVVRKGLLLLVCCLVAVGPQVASAHRSGCHNLHTCPSDTNSYQCGDLGYPCNGASSIDDIELSQINVPLAVEAIFRQVFGRKPTDIESLYWKARFRSDKGSTYKVKRAMRWHEARGSFGPTPVAATAAIEPLSMVKNINAMFRAVYDERNPTVSENKYWLSRIVDKTTEQAMKDAMLYHRLNNIDH